MYKPLSDEEIKKLQDFYVSGQPVRGVATWLEQLRRANALAAAVQADLSHSRACFAEEATEFYANCTDAERALIAALAAYLGEETE